MASERLNFLQATGGICFAHGEYTGQNCPEWPKCATDPHNPEYVALGEEQVRVTNKLYTQAELAAAIATERERVWNEAIQIVVNVNAPLALWRTRIIKEFEAAKVLNPQSIGGNSRRKLRDGK